MTQQSDKLEVDVDHGPDTALSLSVEFYLGASKSFDAACRQFTQACRGLRRNAGAKSNLMVKTSTGEYYCVITDAEGNFDVHPFAEESPGWMPNPETKNAEQGS